MRSRVSSANAGDTVLVPVNGPGTIGAAWMKLGRRFIGIERQIEYVQLALDQWAKIHLQLPLAQVPI